MRATVPRSARSVTTSSLAALRKPYGLIGHGGSSSVACERVPSNTQSVETSSRCAPVALAASTMCRVARTYASHAARRSLDSRAMSLRIAQWTIASGAAAPTWRRTASPSVTSSSACDGPSTSAPWSSANTRATFEPTKPPAPVTSTRTSALPDADRTALAQRAPRGEADHQRGAGVVGADRRRAAVARGGHEGLPLAHVARHVAIEEEVGQGRRAGARGGADDAGVGEGVLRRRHPGGAEHLDALIEAVD